MGPRYRHSSLSLLTVDTALLQDATRREVFLFSPQQHPTRQDKTRYDETLFSNPILDKTRQDKTRRDKTRPYSPSRLLKICVAYIRPNKTSLARGVLEILSKKCGGLLNFSTSIVRRAFERVEVCPIVVIGRQI
jgi:hypothetical protein